MANYARARRGRTQRSTPGAHSTESSWSTCRSSDEGDERTMYGAKADEAGEQTRRQDSSRALGISNSARQHDTGPYA